MAVKFSEFATGSSTGTTTKLVGFDGAAGSETNRQFSISLTGIYSTNGTLSANRTVTMSSNILTFTGGPLNLIPAQSGTALEIINNPPSGTASTSMFKIDESGLFQIGKNVLAKVVGDVAIGKDIDISTTGQQTIVNPAIAIGLGALSIRPDSIAIGSRSRALTKATSIGYQAGLSGTATNAINIGVNTKAGANAINIGVAGSGLGASGQDSIAMGNEADSDGVASIAIGLQAANGGINAISIGKQAGNVFGGDTGISTGADNIFIGRNSTISGTNRAFTNNICIGRESLTTGNSAIAIGLQSSSDDSCIAIGNKSKLIQGSSNSILLNSSGLATNIANQKKFQVYMTDGTTPDFDVIAGGESTLNTSLKITGQGYTELHTASLGGGGGTFTPEWNDSNVQTILLEGNVVIANPTSIKPGATYVLILKQDAEGSHVVEFTGNKYKFPGGTAPTFTLTGGKADVVTLVAYSTDILMCTSVLDFATS